VLALPPTLNREPWPNSWQQPPPAFPRLPSLQPLPLAIRRHAPPAYFGATDTEDFTLGSWCILRNKAFQDAARKTAPALQHVTSNEEWLAWMDSFAKLRNTALHRGIVSLEQYSAARDQLIAAESVSALAPLVKAQRGLLQ